MTEAIRLVIWDLDETLWHGTLVEGGITFRPEVCAIVAELARRGILNSICSKNDKILVRDRLIEAGIWDYFVFPNIAWTPKGPRILTQIAQIQLRASSVLFIDDNPLNLAEAQYHVPDLQIASEDRILTLLDDPRLQGKDDHNLARLHQYKLLERRSVDQREAGADTAAFLRASGITVRFEYDVERHIDRAIELINRTNQLNFTKHRLSEDIEQARSQLRDLLKRFNVYSALVEVRDRYGDHGFAGLYVTEHGEGHLRHFCFSCRILGMGVERWLYDHIGRPHISIRGPVLTDILAESGKVDWITIAPRADSWTPSEAPCLVDNILGRGGCDLEAVMHYCRTISKHAHGEFNQPRDGHDVRIDHSSFLAIAARGASATELEAFTALGYEPRELETALFDARSGSTAWLFSFWQEVDLALYRHRKTGVLVPFARPGLWGRLDATGTEPHDLEERFRNHWTANALVRLKAEFDFVGPIEESHFKENLAAILPNIPEDDQIFVLLQNSFVIGSNGELIQAAHIIQQNSCVKDIAANRSKMNVLDIRDFILDESEVHEWNHFDRNVYFRVFQEIDKLLRLSVH